MSLKDVLNAVGGDPNTLPDNLKSTHYEAIIKKCGGSVDDLPDRLESTYLKRIAECVSGVEPEYITFVIAKTDGHERSFTVKKGTTWVDWCKTTYNEEFEEYEYIISGTTVFDNFIGGRLCLDAELTQLLNVTVNPIIESRTYYDDLL